MEIIFFQIVFVLFGNWVSKIFSFVPKMSPLSTRTQR